MPKTYCWAWNGQPTVSWILFLSNEHLWVPAGMTYNGVYHLNSQKLASNLANVYINSKADYNGGYFKSLDNEKRCDSFKACTRGNWTETFCGGSLNKWFTWRFIRFERAMALMVNPHSSIAAVILLEIYSRGSNYDTYGRFWLLLNLNVQLVFFDRDTQME